MNSKTYGKRRNASATTGPQRTQKALDAIDQQNLTAKPVRPCSITTTVATTRNWSGSPARDTANLEGLSTEDSAGLLLSKGCVTPMICS